MTSGPVDPRSDMDVSLSLDVEDYDFVPQEQAHPVNGFGEGSRPPPPSTGPHRDEPPRKDVT